MLGEYAQNAEETAAYQAISSLPDGIPQAQYSTYLQLVILSRAAIKLGLYDADDRLRRMLVDASILPS